MNSFDGSSSNKSPNSTYITHSERLTTNMQRHHTAMIRQTSHVNATDTFSAEFAVAYPCIRSVTPRGKLPFYLTGTARTQSQLPKIVHPKQPRFADVANVNPPKCNEGPLLGGASFMIEASPVPGDIINQRFFKNSVVLPGLQQVSSPLRTLWRLCPSTLPPATLNHRLVTV
ncbi:hypothetical protein AVEN_68014-1 [Araneus ventricosus]|uniref:Uncharacterized protein n=1 Tax=Araneus ventricosus TaxID=182803 RepID=A0A4Y2K2H5_ARAVE|nr:hypothetical protein AVEN_68014-1 [Araneus ventricosus]